LSITEVATRLGVRRDRVWAWVDNGWLKARKRNVAGSPYYVVDHLDVEAFLFYYGAALDYIQPVHEWQHVWQRGRASFRKKYIHRSDLIDAMGLSKRMFEWLQQFKEFPRAEISLDRLGSIWYKRTDVLNWLCLHPKYHTPATRRELNVHQS
jgi:hypothetical protein